MSKDKIIILVDNVPGEGLLNSWGFSAYIETSEYRILFDADTDPSVLKYNIDALGINVNNLSFCVLSHHHGDHYGGFRYIGSVLPGIKVYVPIDSSEYLRRWGLEPIVVSQPMRISDDIWLTGTLKSWRWGISEQALAIYVEDKGLIVLVGCSHPGVDRLAEVARKISGKDIYLVIGGFHSPSRKSLDNLAKISRFISPCHCSGEHAKEYVRERYPEKFFPARTGTVITL